VESLGHWDISLRGRLGRACVGRSGSNVSSISGDGRRGGNRFGRILLGEFRCEVGGKGWSLRWSGGGELFTEPTWSLAA